MHSPLTAIATSGHRFAQDKKKLHTFKMNANQAPKSPAAAALAYSGHKGSFAGRKAAGNRLAKVPASVTVAELREIIAQAILGELKRLIFLFFAGKAS